MDLILDKRKSGGRHKSQRQKRFEKLRSADIIVAEREMTEICDVFVEGIRF